MRLSREAEGCVAALDAGAAEALCLLVPAAALRAWSGDTPEEREAAVRACSALFGPASLLGCAGNAGAWDSSRACLGACVDACGHPCARTRSSAAGALALVLRPLVVGGKGRLDRGAAPAGLTTGHAPAPPSLPAVAPGVCPTVPRLLLCAEWRPTGTGGGSGGVPWREQGALAAAAGASAGLWQPDGAGRPEGWAALRGRRGLLGRLCLEDPDRAVRAAASATVSTLRAAWAAAGGATGVDDDADAVLAIAAAAAARGAGLAGSSAPRSGAAAGAAAEDEAVEAAARGVMDTLRRLAGAAASSPGARPSGMPCRDGADGAAARFRVLCGAAPSRRTVLGAWRVLRSVRPGGGASLARLVSLAAMAVAQSPGDRSGEARCEEHRMQGLATAAAAALDAAGSDASWWGRLARACAESPPRLPALAADLLSGLRSGACSLPAGSAVPVPGRAAKRGRPPGTSVGGVSADSGAGTAREGRAASAEEAARAVRDLAGWLARSPAGAAGLKGSLATGDEAEQCRDVLLGRPV